MKRAIVVLSVAIFVLFALAAWAQVAPKGAAYAAPQIQNNGVRSPQFGHVWVPESSKVTEKGWAHTNIVVWSPDGNKPAGMSSPKELMTIVGDSSGEVPETPASLGCIYVNSPSYSGCVPDYSSGTGGPSSSGYGAIAIVDAYDNPDASSDLSTFDGYWGLAAPPHFIKVKAKNTSIGCGTPRADSGWSLESSLDIEWAHVFAPKAVIILVEASDNSDTCLYYAEQVAMTYIVNHYSSGGQVSNSWGGAEDNSQIESDPYFAGWNYSYTRPITAFASAGDDGCGVEYPSANPWVVSAGGTGIIRNTSNGHFMSEACWGGSGGGVSDVEFYTSDFTGGNIGPWANYQYPIFGEYYRSVPDMSFDADPSSGAYVYSAYGAGGWAVVGGTSLSSPALASIVNRANNRLGGLYLYPIMGNDGYFMAEENNLIYSQLPAHTAYGKNFYDVTSGSNGCYNSAIASWDFCTGVGSPRGLLGK